MTRELTPMERDAAISLCCARLTAAGDEGHRTSHVVPGPCSFCCAYIADGVDGAAATPANTEGITAIDIVKFRAGLHATFNGGWHDSKDGYEAFHHGMDTVCNVIADKYTLTHGETK